MSAVESYSYVFMQKENIHVKNIISLLKVLIYYIFS